jgi:hypothetical protein
MAFCLAPNIRPSFGQAFDVETERLIFFSKSILSGSHNIYIANGSHLNVSHIGFVFTQQLFVSDTYLVPNLSLNLLSVGQLCELGLKLYFFNEGCDMHDPRMGQLFRTDRKIRNFFELSSLYLPSTVSVATPSRSSSTTLSLLYSRLGYGLFLACVL